MKSTCGGTRSEFIIRRGHLTSCSKLISTTLGTFARIFGFEYPFLNLKFWVQKTELKFEFIKLILGKKVSDSET